MDTLNITEFSEWLQKNLAIWHANSNKKTSYEPGQFCVLHTSVVRFSPAHVCPPLDGSELVQFLLRVRAPSPQLFVHPDHADQLVQPPCTVTVKIQTIVKKRQQQVYVNLFIFSAFFSIRIIEIVEKQLYKRSSLQMFRRQLIECRRVPNGIILTQIPMERD